MKYLALTVFLAVMQTGPPVPRKATDTPAGSSQSVQKHAAANKQPSNAALPVKNADCPQTDQNASSTPSEANGNKTIIIREPASVSNWEKVYVIFTGLLVVVGGVGIGYAIKSLRAVERQAKANEDQLTEIQQSAEKSDRMILLTAQQAENSRVTTEVAKQSADAAKASADAALLNARAVVNSERPWLFMTINEAKQVPLDTWVRFGVVNRGRTPAEVTFFIGDFTWAEPETMEPTPKYPAAGREFSHKKYLATDDTLGIYDFPCRTILQNGEDEWRLNNQQGKRLVFFGHVLYRDLITREEHETRYCYWLSPADWVGLIIGGPPGWNEHT